MGDSNKSRFYPRIFFSILVFATLLLAFYITKPFLPALLTGSIIAYLSYPLYEKTLKRIKSRVISSLIVTILIILIFTVPVALVIGLVSKQAYSTYSSINQNNLGTNFLKVVCKDENWASCRALKSFLGFLPEEDLDYYLQSSIQKITGFIITNVSNLAASIPSILLNFFVMVFVVYYLLIDGQAIAKRIKNMLPLKESHKQHVLDKFHDVTTAVFYGNITMALVQGTLGGIGFWVLGVPSAILWGFVMTIFALIPYFGAAVVWLPASLNLIFMGYLQNNGSATTRGIILMAYGLFIVSSIDNILKPRLIGVKGRVHPILVLIGVLGGLSLFGFIGLVLGPVMLALLMTFVDIYEDEKAEMDKYFD